MKKLKLESLDVTSFETSSVPRIRGTLRAHEDTEVLPWPETEFGCTEFYCPTTPDMDCTYGCSHNTDCHEQCWGDVLPTVYCEG